jgi:ubiquinone biosynthesis protein
MLYAINRYARIFKAFLTLWLRLISGIGIRLYDKLRRAPVRKTDPLPRMLREMLERLGGTFIKFGQIMAMRPDLLPPAYIDELSALLDNANTFPYETAARQIEAELGKPVGELFQSIDPVPLAAASFAQVHRARLQTGEDVVVKVQRPGLKKLVEVDLTFIKFLAWLINFSGILSRIDVRPIVNDMIEWTYDEINYLTESAHAERMRRSSNLNPHEYIPKIYWDYTTRNVMTLEYLSGVWVSRILTAISSKDEGFLARAREDGVDLRKVAYNLFHGSLRQAFEEESFHADPHAGNLVILENNVIGYIDFGITGQLDEAFRSNQLLIFNAIQQGNLESYARGLLRLFEPPPEDTDIEGFKEEVKKNTRRWFTNLYNPKCDLKERSIAFLLTGNFALARRYGLTYGQLAVRYYRALLVMELIVLRLDPGFDFRVELRTFFTRYGLRGILRDRAPSRVLLDAFRFRNFVRRFPDLAVNVVELVDREISTVRTELSSVKVFASRFFKMASIAAIVLSLVIIASTIIWPGFLRQAMGVNPLWVCVLLGMLALFSAWVARQLSNRSVRRGVYTSR